MFGFDRSAAKAAWSIFLIALALFILYAIRKVLLVFVLAVLFAYLLSPVVNLIDRFIRYPRSRPYSLALVYVLLLAIIIGGGIFIGGRVNEEATTLSKRFPEIVEGIKKNLEDPRPAWLAPAKRYLLAQISERAQSFSAMLLPVVKSISTHAVEVVSSAAFLVLIPILSFFFLKDGRELKEQVLSIAGKSRPVWEDIFADLHILLGQFIRALVILAAATLTVYSIFFSILGLPYAILLASAAALLEFIPVVGPFTGAVLIIITSAFAGASVLVVVIFLAIYRLFQDYVLNPQLMGQGIELHPLLVIFGALAGEEIAGIPGMFLSVPVLAALRVFYVRMRRARVVPESVSIAAPSEEIIPPK